MRQEAQNERQLRWALKLYWQTEKEDAARPDPIGAHAAQRIPKILKCLWHSR